MEILSNTNCVGTPVELHPWDINKTYIEKTW